MQTKRQKWSTIPTPPLTMQPLNACLVGSKRVKTKVGRMKVQMIGQGKLARVQLTLKYTGTGKKRYATLLAQSYF
jgi:hypothetical protein